MALVDMVQQFAKLGEAVQVLGLPHEMQDAVDATAHDRGRGDQLPQDQLCLSERPERAQGFRARRAGRSKDRLGRTLGSGKSTIIALLQRLYDPPRRGVGRRFRISRA